MNTQNAQEDQLDQFHEENFDPVTCDSETLAAAIICAPNPLRFSYLCGVQHARNTHGMSESMKQAFSSGEEYFKIILLAATNNGKQQYGFLS